MVKKKSAAIKRNTFINSKLSIIVNVMILILGSTSLVVSALSKENESFLLSFRYMTFNGTVFSTLVSAIVLLLCVKESRTGRAFWQKRMYFFRLSSAVTEIIIAVVIALSFLPSVPDSPNLLSYDSFNMHVIIPVLSVLSFLLHPTAAGNTRMLTHLTCAWLITLYSAVIITLIAFDMLPQKLIPYSFLDIHTMPIWYIAAFGTFIFSFAYVLSFILTDVQDRLCFARQTKKPVSSK